MKRNIFDCLAYACYLNDEEELKQSTSGGVFFGIAKSIIENGGIVFGATMDDDFNVYHKRVATLGELCDLRKSKYVQSRIGNSYKIAEMELKKGRTVLFSGTPCQIAGLRSYLRREYENLFTIDIICHGVPNNQLFKDHLDTISRQKQKKISEYQFRDKKNGWANHTVSYRFDNKCNYMKSHEDAYFYAFDMFYSLRKVCYECPFRGMESGADMTIGDYWGLTTAHPYFNNSMGVSAVVIKTDKGNELFEKNKKAFTYIHTEVRKIALYNIFLCCVIGKKVMRNMFFDRYIQGEHDIFRICKKIESEIIPRRIGIIGSYSSRVSVHQMNSYDPGIQISWQISNSSLISMMSTRKCSLNSVYEYQQNEYRLKMLKMDFEKEARTLINSEPELDYLVIDFMDDRLTTLYMKDGSYITESEALLDTKEVIKNEVQQRIDPTDIDITMWKACCLELIQCLKKRFKPNQIILNCLYLTGYYGTFQREKKFVEKESIQAINECLRMRYDFFKENYEGILCIDICNDDTDFCSTNFLYGCKPEYYNIARYNEINEEIFRQMEA